jgi:hypothetical protein
MTSLVAQANTMCYVAAELDCHCALRPLFIYFLQVTAVPEKPQAADTVINRSARDLLAQHQQWQARRQRQALRGQQQQEQEQGSGNGDEGVVESQDGSTQRDDEEQERGGQMSQPPEAPPQADHQQPALCIISDDRGFKVCREMR